MPESVKVHVAPESCHTCFGNVIACNDSVALVHPDLSQEIVDLLESALKVKVYRTTIGVCPLVGTKCILTNEEGLVNDVIGVHEMF